MTERPTQAEYWNAYAGEHWAASYERFDDLLGGYGRATISALDAEADERILDVGCGAGGTTLDVGRLLAPRGKVVGIDLSKQMITVARERAASEGLTNVEFIEGDVTTHPFEPASFNAFMSRFGVMFFEDPTAAFTRIGGLLTPGGRAAFVCWQEALQNEWLMVPLAALARHVPPPPQAEPGAPGQFALADADRLRSIMESSGFEDVFIEPISMDQRLGADPDEALQFFAANSIVMGMLADASEDTKRAALAAVREAFAPHARDGGVFLSGAAWLVTAHTPE